ncbi:methyltransferase-like protein 22 [Microplitis mediator]|uniref:methyltransferase-like protein 22 n=1 Tax=Microplitis mediator TaxID=375433 RepID=UPI0025532B72|nr:methyltransferase-like protein 22 [Microplitis mediator]XP_057328194.1 methyltransferase-like protein 22 [Microplitis mediator]XP_057328195.1 methyltransferase-like protein 22 [Microplitis mediator]XP_057328197.1 methyltransferase-like protein 22 [Microplitis mediator]
MSNFRVTSEIHTENRNVTPSNEKNNSTISKFMFNYPVHMLNLKNKEIKYDSDEDLILDRTKTGQLFIEHSISTELQLVGLQVWRGAFLLADYIFDNPKIFKNKNIIELGSGVGLTSIVASMLAHQVTCTDINSHGIIELIKRNFERNSRYIKAKFDVMELNFLDCNWSSDLTEKILETTIILAADVIYDNEITEGFVDTLSKLLDSDTKRTAYVALEKRFVFTIADLDSVAPMYEEFMRCIARRNLNWKIENINIDFPQYFQYNRNEQLILMKIYSKN